MATLDTPTSKALKMFSSFPYNISIATELKITMFVKQMSFNQITYLEKRFQHVTKEFTGLFNIVVLVRDVERMVVLVDQDDAWLAMVLS